jgi:thioredoxin reductase (NADPH)
VDDGGARAVDCLVVGGGPAGLSAAVYLGRLRRSVTVVDDRFGRSLWSQVNRNYLGFPDGVEALDLRQRGREQAARYGVTFLAGSVAALERDQGRFSARVEARGEGDGGNELNTRDDLAHGERVGERRVVGAHGLTARTVILATGVADRFPSFPGSDECIGRTLFWCLICDGYETAGKRVVLIGDDDEAGEAALQLTEMGAQVTLVADANALAVDEDARDALAAAGIAVHESAVREYAADAGCVRSLELDDADGTRLGLDLLFVLRPARPRTDLAIALGADVDENGYVIADREQQTNVPGLFAAGDVTRAHNHQVSSAVHEGGMAAAAANYVLFERWRERLGG